MPGSDKFAAKILRLIGAIAVEHSGADFLLTFLLSQIYCREMTLGSNIFREMFFGKKVELLSKAITQLTPEKDGKGLLPRSEYKNALDLLSKLREAGKRRNDLMHGIAQAATDGDFAVMRRPNKKGGGVDLDEHSLNRILGELRTLPGKTALQILRIEKDIRDRQEAKASQLKGSKIQIATRSVTGRIGNRTFQELRSTRKTIPPEGKR
ncbi:MAG: hypothetical protein ACLQPN_09220 [Bryobacteraceae bacterium]